MTRTYRGKNLHISTRWLNNVRRKKRRGHRRKRTYNRGLLASTNDDVIGDLALTLRTRAYDKKWNLP